MLMQHTPWITCALFLISPSTRSASAAPSSQEPPQARCLDEVYETVNTEFHDYLDSRTDFPDQVDECEESIEGCILTQAQNEFAKQFLDSTLGGRLDDFGFLPACRP